jgi:hypothetical protein
MFKLFQALLAGKKRGNYPESLINTAIERAIDGTDPWLRAVSGYKKKLRPAVLRSIDHIVTLVDGLPSPVPFCRENYGNDPHLKTFFISPDDMENTFRRDQNLTKHRREQGNGPVVAMLAMQKIEKNQFGVEMVDDRIVRDVAQVSVSFEGHRLICPTGNEAETRKQLKLRAFDHLLGLALQRISIVKTTREELERRRQLLQAKRNLLDRGEWGFNEPGSSERLNIAQVEAHLAKIEANLRELGGDDHMFETYLNIVVDVLGQPERYLWSRKETYFVDSRGIKRDQEDGTTTGLVMDELINSAGNRLVITLITLPAAAA